MQLTLDELYKTSHVAVSTAGRLGTNGRLTRSLALTLVVRGVRRVITASRHAVAGAGKDAQNVASHGRLSPRDVDPPSRRVDSAQFGERSPELSKDTAL